MPLLIDDETQTTLWESNSIVRYLAAQYGINRLWIDAPAQRAQAEKWMDWANGTLSPVHRIILTGLVRTPPAQRDAAAIEAAIAEAEALLVILDAALGECEWLSGAEFGVGDIAVAPFIWNMMGAVDRWQPHPNLQRWSQQLSRRPAYQSCLLYTSPSPRDV